jgi:hypothetical protein
MMALHVGVRRSQPFAGIIGYSGRLIATHMLADELRSRPPLLLVPGTDDMRVPFQSMMEAETVLRRPVFRSSLWPASAPGLDQAENAGVSRLAARGSWLCASSRRAFPAYCRGAGSRAPVLVGDP